jgi:hypothetical protein
MTAYHGSSKINLHKVSRRLKILLMPAITKINYYRALHQRHVNRYGLQLGRHGISVAASFFVPLIID